MRRLAAILGFALLAPLGAGAIDLPEYFQTALARLSSDAPRGWAYNLTTTRKEETSLERYDPSRPKGGEWTLLRRNGLEPTTEDHERYRRYKASNASPTARATFEKGDIDVTSAALVRDDAERAEFQLRFREDVSEPLLQHLLLHLTVTKAEPTVERFTLHLLGAFSPALGVRMNQLEVTMQFSPASDDRPALPHEMVSRFRGRLFFFIPMEEELRVTYSDFAPVIPLRK
ncbi:MAG: hypothetical protein Q8J74_04325 [Candidatus Didemnitutus sp.]|nr:hypothetical protein [Candidatus Didemnitutus sp.]